MQLASEEELRHLFGANRTPLHIMDAIDFLADVPFLLKGCKIDFFVNCLF